MKIITNNQPREILSGWELPENLRSEFDYYETNDDFYSASFFKYKGKYYDLSQFVRCNIEGWQGCHNDSYFSGLFIKFTNSNDAVIVASYYS
jgi:hypothetical protein